MIRKTKLGQNFLKDPKIIRKIVDFAQINTKDTIEIGPGEGILTEELLQRGFRVLAIEKDEQLTNKLKLRFKDYIDQGKLNIIKADFLEEDLDSQIEEFGIKDYILLGNIPYYITGAIFRKVFDLKNLPKSLTFVVQKEVAQRIVAKNGKESILSIAIKVYGEPKMGTVIRAGSFHPRPKVDSAILNIENINKEKFNRSIEFENNFFLLIKTGFSHKRKFLIKNLVPLFRKNIEELKEIFKENKIPENIRAEDLSLDNWFYITKKFSPPK